MTMHQPVETRQIFHNLTLDGNDIELTRLIEWIDSEWLKDNCALNISNVMWDNGHDTLRFETNCDIINAYIQVQAISARFPTIFIMYDYYTGEDEENYNEGVLWFYEGIPQERPHNVKG